MWNFAAARQSGPSPSSSPPALNAAGWERRTSRSSGGASRLLQFSALCAALLSPWLAEAGPKVASVFCSSDTSAQNDIQKKLQDSKLFDKVDNVDMGSSAPTLATLQQYDALLVWADTSRGCSDPTNVGNVLAQYIDAGGGVVQVLPYYVNNSYSNIGGDFITRYSLVDQGGMVNTRSLAFGMKSEAHPVLDGVTTISEIGNSCYHRSSLGTSNLKNGGRIVATWSDSKPMVIVGSPSGHNRVDLNVYISTNDIGYAGCLDPKTDAYKLIGQSLSWVANPLRATPSTADFGDVPAGTTSLPLDVEIKNTGKDPITLSGDSLGTATEFTVKLLGGAAFPLTLNGGDKFTIEATVRPSASGRRNASYTLSTSTPGASGLVVPLTVNSLGPVFKVDPTQIAFGGLPTGGMPRTTTVTISNNGGGLLNLNTTPSLSDTTNFSIVSPIMTPISLAAGASVSFVVKFNPTVEKLYSAYLTIPYNDGVDRSMQVPLTGSFGKPKITVPGSIVMTPVRVSANGPSQDIVVTNSGLADLTISAVAFTGKDVGDFLALTVPTMMAPIVVKPNGGSVALQVQCNPTVQGLRQATFNITSDDPALMMASTVNLQCSGVVANFNMTPDKIDFTVAQQTGQCTSPKTVTISNSGTDSLRVLSIGFSGPKASSFSSTVTGARIVASSGGTLNIPVQFCPQDIGAQSADLVITTDLTAGHTAKVPLTGIGTGPKVVYSPSTVDFGPVYINTKSAPQVIQLSNGGDQPLVFGANTLTPPTGPFTVVGLPPSGTKLNKGDPPIMVSVTVSPTMAMQMTADLAIVVNDQVQKGNLHIPLSAVGTQAAVSVQPMMLTFPGTTIIGTSSAPQMVTVTNTGMAPLTGIDVQVAGMHSTDFTANPASIPAMVMTGQSFQFPVAFRPTAANTRNGIIVVKAAGLPTPVQIMATGNGKLLTITCSPDSRNFGNLPVGESKVDKITCRNGDSNPIDFVTGFTDFPDDWSIDPAAATISPAMGGDEGVVTMTLTFKPTTTGPRTTTLNIKTKDGIMIGSVDLDGNGTTPPKDKPMASIGCAYSGHSAPTPIALSLLMLAGALLLRRRRIA